MAPNPRESPHGNGRCQLVERHGGPVVFAEDAPRGIRLGGQRRRPPGAVRPQHQAIVLCWRMTFCIGNHLAHSRCRHRCAPCCVIDLKRLVRRVSQLVLLDFKKLWDIIFCTNAIDQQSAAVQCVLPNGTVHLVEVHLVTSVGAQAVRCDHIDQYRAFRGSYRCIRVLTLA